MRPLFFVALIIAGALYYLLYYPPKVLEDKTQAALDTFAASVQLKNRDSISEALHKLLDEDVKVTLEVSFFSLRGAGANRATVQEMNKSEFILFIDNVLYPLSDYGYEATLDNFVLTPDRKEAAVGFSSRQWAEGASLMGGVSLGMRYDSSADCSGQVFFEEESAVQLYRVHCKVRLRPTSMQSPSDVMKQISR